MRRHGLHQVSAPSSAQMCLRLVSRRGPHAIDMGSAVATTRHHVTAFCQSIQNWALDARVWCQARHWRLFLHLCRICKRCTMCKTIQHLLVGFVGLHWNSCYFGAFTTDPNGTWQCRRWSFPVRAPQQNWFNWNAPKLHLPNTLAFKSSLFIMNFDMMWWEDLEAKKI